MITPWREMVYGCASVEPPAHNRGIGSDVFAARTTSSGAGWLFKYVFANTISSGGASQSGGGERREGVR